MFFYPDFDCGEESSMWLVHRILYPTLTTYFITNMFSTTTLTTNNNFTMYNLSIKLFIIFFDLISKNLIYITYTIPLLTIISSHGETMVELIMKIY